MFVRPLKKRMIKKTVLSVKMIQNYAFHSFKQFKGRVMNEGRIIFPKLAKIPFNSPLCNCNFLFLLYLCFLSTFLRYSFTVLSQRLYCLGRSRKIPSTGAVQIILSG